MNEALLVAGVIVAVGAGIVLAIIRGFHILTTKMIEARDESLKPGNLLEWAYEMNEAMTALSNDPTLARDVRLGVAVHRLILLQHLLNSVGEAIKVTDARRSYEAGEVAQGYESHQAKYDQLGKFLTGQRTDYEALQELIEDAQATVRAIQLAENHIK